MKNKYKTSGKRLKTTKIIGREEWAIYLFTVFLAWLTFFISYGFYKNNKVLNEHTIIKIKPYWHVESQPWKNSTYDILFYYKEEKIRIGISPKTYKTFQRDGQVDLLYNKELNQFLDPNCKKFYIHIDIFFATLTGLLLLLFLKEIFFGKYRWRH